MDASPESRARAATVTPVEAAYIRRRLAAHVEVVGDCWLWTAAVTEGGYGRLAYGRRAVWLAHRLAYLAEHGEIPEGVMVLHTCDTPACVRPAHLYSGSAADNSRDRGERTGWSGKAPGVRNANAKLTDDQVREMRRRAAAGESRSALGRAYGVSRQTASDVIDRKLWRHVE